jgi:hypothetical protein
MRMVINMRIKQSSFHSVSVETNMFITNRGRKRAAPIKIGKKFIKAKTIK